MKRRDFIQNIALASVAIPVLNSCTPNKKENTSPLAESTSSKEFAIHEITIDELQQKMKSGEMTSRSITEMYLSRISTIDKTGPSINSVIELNPDAIAIAEAMDTERKSGKVRGPLHGIPVLIKDNIDTADKMMNTAGSIAMEGNLPIEDAFIIKRLRLEGAVLLGKTNPSEWANFRSSKSTSGWSSRGGQTKNPYVLDRNPSGSSSGSGVAVSANLCTLAIGTETDGSIISPASVNGVVGIKPTVGLWSRSGIIPISHTTDTAGPMSRTVKDAAILLGALTGIDESDIASKKSEGKFEKDYTIFLDKKGLKGKRLGFEKAFLKGHAGVEILLTKAMEQIKNQGAEIIEIDSIKPLEETGKDEITILLYEFKTGLNKYLSSAKGKVKSLKELIEFNKQNEAKAMPWFKQELLERSEAKGDLNSKEYIEALNRLLNITRNTIIKTLNDNRLDAICWPSNGPASCTDLINGDYSTGYGYTSPAAVAGFPHITVPMGHVHELPIGLSFFGREFSEGLLISLAYSYEQASMNRKAPEFKSTIFA
jgi:amidase